jgi:hypothetical protein
MKKLNISIINLDRQSRYLANENRTKMPKAMLKRNWMKLVLDFSVPFESSVDALLRGDLGLKVQVRCVSGKELELFTEVQVMRA